MKILNSKKADGGITIIIVILIIAVFLGWLVNFNSKECRNNSECNSGYYCGSDFSCHQFPKENTIVKNNLILPSIIVGIAIVIGAFILRSGKFNKSKDESFEKNQNQTTLRTP